MTGKTIKIKPVKIEKIKEPQLREISFSGNMPSPYEKELRKVLAKRAMRRRK